MSIVWNFIPLKRQNNMYITCRETETLKCMLLDAVFTNREYLKANRANIFFFLSCNSCSPNPFLILLVSIFKNCIFHFAKITKSNTRKCLFVQLFFSRFSFENKYIEDHSTRFAEDVLLCIACSMLST